MLCFYIFLGIKVTITRRHIRIVTQRANLSHIDTQRKAEAMGFVQSRGGSI